VGVPPTQIATDYAVEVENNNGETMGSNTRKKKFLLGIFLLAVVHLSQAQANKQPLDTVITNGHIIDGTGSPWYSGDIGIRSGKIAAIGNLSGSQRTRTIDVHGMVVAPGFIDM
jgi:urease alpha subunit